MKVLFGCILILCIMMLLASCGGECGCVNCENCSVNAVKDTAQEGVDEQLPIDRDNPFLNPPSDSELSSITVYRTPSGRRYHLDRNCGGKNSFTTTVYDALDAGLTPCKKCVR